MTGSRRRIDVDKDREEASADQAAARQAYLLSEATRPRSGLRPGELMAQASPGVDEEDAW